MKKLAIVVQIAFLILIFSGSCNNKQKAKGTYSVINIPAPSLKNNLVGDDTIQKIGIYLPPSYYSSKKTYPVVYFLLGHSTRVMDSIPTIFGIMENSTVQEMIYVQISGYNLFKGSMYINSPVTGNWEDYVTEDVVSFVDKNYRTIPEKASRGLAGHSMGGLGAFNISLKHPDEFAAIQLMSPAINADYDIINWLFSNDSTIISLNDLSHKMESVQGNGYAERITKTINETGNLWLAVGLGTAFSPDAKQPLLMDLPFNYNKDGTFERNEKVWNLWRNGTGNLTWKVKKYKDSLSKYAYYGMEVGYYDQIGFNIKGVKKLSACLTSENIPHTVHYFNGDHYDGLDKDLEHRVMPLLSIYLKGER